MLPSLHFWTANILWSSIFLTYLCFNSSVYSILHLCVLSCLCCWPGVGPLQWSSGFGQWPPSSPSCPSIWNCGCHMIRKLSDAWPTSTAVISTPMQRTLCLPQLFHSTCRWWWWFSCTPASFKRLRNSWRRSEGGRGTFITCITLHSRLLPMVVLQWIH